MASKVLPIPQRRFCEGDDEEDHTFPVTGSQNGSLASGYTKDDVHGQFVSQASNYRLSQHISTSGRSRSESISDLLLPSLCQKDTEDKEGGITISKDDDYDHSVFAFEEEDEELSQAYAEGRKICWSLRNENSFDEKTSAESVAEQLVDAITRKRSYLATQGGIYSPTQSGYCAGVIACEKLDALPGKTCSACHIKTRVEDLRSLKPGMHLCFGGQYLKRNKTEAGEFKQESVYQHHVLVESIPKLETTTKGSIGVIHFAKIGPGNIKVVKATNKYDLRYDEIYIVSYRNGHSAETVLKRAEQYLNKEVPNKCYNPLTFNCESFCTWCSVGDETSFQAMSFRDSIFDMLRSLETRSKFLEHIVSAIFKGSDEIARATGSIKFNPENLLGVSTATYLIYCITRTYSLMSKPFCWNCRKKKLIELWVDFGTYLVTSGASMAVMLLLVPLLSQPWGLAMIAVLLFLSVGICYAVSWVVKCQWSPFPGEKIAIKSVEEIKPADVLTFKYCYLPHDFFVKEIVSRLSLTQATIKAIHYGTETWFSTRKVVEEIVLIDLDKENVYRHDYTDFQTFSAEKTISRMICRVGEEKHSHFYHRSSHLCYWGKLDTGLKIYDIRVDESPIQESTKCGPKSSLVTKEDPIMIRNDIRKGDIVRIEKLPGCKRAICTDLQVVYSHIQCFKMEVVYMTKEKEIKRATVDIDLRYDNVLVYRYHPAHCVLRSERIWRALSMVGKSPGYKDPVKFVVQCALK